MARTAEKCSGRRLQPMERDKELGRGARGMTIGLQGSTIEAGIGMAVSRSVEIVALTRKRGPTGFRLACKSVAAGEAREGVARTDHTDHSTALMLSRLIQKASLNHQGRQSPDMRPNWWLSHLKVRQVHKNSSCSNQIVSVALLCLSAMSQSLLSKVDLCLAVQQQACLADKSKGLCRRRCFQSP